MKLYSIGAVAKLTGLSVHNLRVWEKRHQAVETERTDTGRRLYSEAALQRLQLLKRCVDQGLAISTIAHLSERELQENLATFASGPVRSTTKPSLHVCVVGNELAQTVEQVLQVGFHLDHMARFGHTQALQAADINGQVDLLVIDQPSLSATDAKPVGNLFKRINARVNVLVYRYSRQQDVAYLRTLGVHTLKAPFDRNDLGELLHRLLKAPVQQPTLYVSKQAPERRYSDLALQKAANLSSSIDCECPHHLAELIKELLAFETYSSQCQSKDKAGEDLHRHIYLRTAQARAIMEELLQSVLEQEGIDLSVSAV